MNSRPTAGRQDLADVAVAVAADPAAHRNRAYELTGSSTVTAANCQLAAVLSVEYRPVSLAEQRQSLTGAGLMPFQPAMLMSIYSATANGFLDTTRGDLAHLLARSPRPIMPIAAATARGCAVP